MTTSETIPESHAQSRNSWDCLRLPLKIIGTLVIFSAWSYAALILFLFGLYGFDSNHRPIQWWRILPAIICPLLSIPVSWIIELIWKWNQMESEERQYQRLNTDDGSAYPEASPTILRSGVPLQTACLVCAGMIGWGLVCAFTIGDCGSRDCEAKVFVPVCVAVLTLCLLIGTASHQDASETNHEQDQQCPLLLNVLAPFFDFWDSSSWRDVWNGVQVCYLKVRSTNLVGSLRAWDW